MRNAQLLRTSSSQTVCVFCACRLSGDVVATRATSRLSFAQRRSISASASTRETSRPPFLRDSGQAGQPSSVFPDAASEARKALLAMQERSTKQQDTHESNRLFGSQNTGNRQANPSQPVESSSATSKTPSVRSQNSGKTAGPTINAESATSSPNERDRQGQRQRREPRQRRGNGHVVNEGNTRASNGGSMPPLDVSEQKSVPKVQPPPWMKSAAQSNTPTSAPPRAPWLSTSQPQQAGSAPATLSKSSSDPTPPAQSPIATASSLFSQFDASRQALASTQTRQEERRPNPTSNAMSAPKPVHASGTTRLSDARNGDRDTSPFSSLPDWTGDNATSSSTHESQTTTYSPFGAVDSLRNTQANAAEDGSRQRQGRQRRPRTYNVTMSNGSRSQNTDEPFDPELSSNWSILNQNQRSQSQQQAGADERRSSFNTPQDIDAKFEEYRNRRPANGIDLNNITYGRRTTPPPRRERIETRTCARCGQVGHLAKFCENPPQPQRQSNRRDSNEAANPFAGKQARKDYRQDTPSQRDGGFRIRRVDGNNVEINKEKQEMDEEEEEDDDDDERPLRRQEKPIRKFTKAPPAPEPEQGRAVRRSGRFGDEEEDAPTSKPSRPRRRRNEENEDDDDRPGRRNRFNEDDDAEFSFEDFEGARERRMERKKARQMKKDKAAREAAKTADRRARKAEGLTPIRLPEFISVSNLAQILGVRYETFVTKMEELGFTNHSHDHVLTAENASLIAMEYDFDPVIGDPEGEEADERDLKAQPLPEDVDFLPTRPPVVAIMGHVDHGKTTILDFLRKSSVAASEHGGITQHIGAFSVGLSSGKTITFLDTPGHAAFLEMRKRGATVTDIIILVVAADDSVKPQTIEAIKHAKAANVPIIVAINKIDKEEANIDRVKQDLARHEVEIEDYGGDTQVVPVSGKTGAGISELEDNIVTLSEILDHRAEATGTVEGWVLEATTKKAGRVATVLVRRGTLKPGSIIVAGKTWTRVRSLRNEAGVTIMSAGPGTPVEVDGWRDQPNAGDEALEAPNEQKAANVVEYRRVLEERKQMAEDMEAINDARRLEAEKRERLAAETAAKAAAEADAADAETTSSSSSAAARKAAAQDAEEPEELNATPGHQTVPFIIKADVSGSVEAVSAYLLQMSNPLCSPTILRAGVGPVSEFDVEHAAAANGHIISFNLAPALEMSGQAEKRGVRLIEENVIYRIVGDVRGVLEEKLPPLKTQRVVGEADVAMAFEIGVGGRKKVRIAGCKVRNGMIARGSRVRVLRGERKVYDGVLSSLKNVKKDVQEMRKGTECGMGFEDWEEFEVGDQIQTYEEKVERRKLQI